MQKLIAKVAKTLLTGATVLVTIAIAIPQAVASTLIQEDLFFGRNLSGGGQISDEQFQAFVNNVITPRFPAGLTIFEANGKFENNKIVTLFVEDNLDTKNAIAEIVAAYQQQFQQKNVLQVNNQDRLKVGFGAGENLIDNDPIPEFIQTDLFFGRNIAGGKQVTQEQFQAFVDKVITPRFPAGLTIFEANGQFQNSTGAIVREPSKVVRLLLEDTEENETALDEIIRAYIKQFNQESVLLAVNEEIAVGFGAGENLIDNDPIPELIQTDLFFGRNIVGGKQVTQEQFQAFVDKVIAPRFPAGLTIFEANGQFQNSTGAIVREPSKVVRLLLEDTQKNETALDEIIKAYIKQFNQESVLAVVDEDVEVVFDAKSPPSVPEPKSAIALTTLGMLMLKAIVRQKKI
jgi:transcription termination factor NusB